MRLRRLDLARYGCFTDFAVDFGERDPGKPDLHVIYGPNEAGKSTLLAAFLDLMFGIEVRSPYDFLHDYRSMRVGGVLNTDDEETHELARIKRDSKNLLDPDDRPLPESLLTSVLGSIDRASYTTMFSLDDDTLQSGGESILQSEGDLGRLLFSATSGLSELSRQLDEIKGEAEAFHRPGARASELKRFKDALADLKGRQSELDTNARRYAELHQLADAAGSAYETARTERDQTRIRHGRVQRLLDALPMWAHLKDLRSKLEPLRELPDPPAGWAAEARQLSQDEASKKADITGAEEDLARLTGELEGMAVDQGILGVAAQIDRLGDDEARYRSAVDIPLRENEQQGVQRQIGELLKALGRLADEDPRALALPAATVGALSELIETRSGLLAQGESARRERDAALDRLEQAAKSVEALGQASDVSGLEVTLKRLSGHDLVARLGEARRREAALAGEIEEGMSGLAPWRGDLGVLAASQPPGRGRIERWKREQARCRDEQAVLSRKQAEAVEARDRLRAEAASIRERSGAIDDDAVAGARATRDRAWQAHRRLLDANTTATGAVDGKALRASADAVEAAMADLDRMVEQQAHHSVDMARLRHGGEELARIEASLVHDSQRLETLAGDVTALGAEITEALRPLGLPAEMELTDLELWLDRREQVLRKRREFLQAKAKTGAAETAAAEARTRMVAAMAPAGCLPDDDLDLPQLCDMAEDFITQAKEQRTAIAAAGAAHKECQLGLEERERDLAEAARGQERWRERWKALLAGCWLSEADAERSPGEVKEILKALSALPLLIAEHDDLGRRIRSMAEDRARFLAKVEEIAGAVGAAFQEAEVLDAADSLSHRLTAARQQANLRDSKKADLEREEQHLRAAKQAMSEIEARRLEMAALFAVDSLTGLLQKLDQAKEKSDLAQQIATRERELLEALKLPSLTAAESALAEVAGDEAGIEALHGQRVELESRLEAEDERVTHLYHERMTAKAAVDKVGGDGEVARLEEERRTLLLEIQEQAERHLRLKVGVAAAERALRIYRDRHRGSMMTRAGEAFRSITGSRFTNLTTVPGKDGEVLVGIQASGGSLIASEMSKGTRFQLYLALRIAGYHEFAAHHETLPFVADDIMETFDDERSAEALKLLSEMAEKGQVIYLTHHAHMRDIAREAGGKGVQLHELPALKTSAAGTP